jgi:hypothetical protein
MREDRRLDELHHNQRDLRLRRQDESDEARRLSTAARRLATWGLVAFGVLFVLDGPVGGDARNVEPVVAERDGTDRPAVRAAIMTHLQDRRSSLSPEERERVIEAVLRSSRRYGLDPFLVTAVLLVESDARPWAESHKGAIGLMQVMPHMAASLPLSGNLATIESNVEAGCFILADNIRRLGEARGISSYFWGRQIGSVAYFEKVQRARDRVRRASTS